MGDYRTAWLELNKRLHHSCEQIIVQLSNRESDSVILVVKGFLLKATRTLAGCNLLIDHSLWEQAQILARVLLELRITFDYFLKMLQHDARIACERVIDSMILEKIKQLASANYLGLDLVEGGPTRDDFQRVLVQMKKRYSPSELSRMRKHGFTGLSLEERAKQVGHEMAYQVVYRNLSRNIHSTDYTEHMGLDVLDEDSQRKFIDSRDEMTFYVAHFAAGGIAEFVNYMFNCEMDEILDHIGQDKSLLKDGVTI